MANEVSEIVALLRARNSLIWVSSTEEMRVERGLIEAAATCKYAVRFWDCAFGVTDVLGQPFGPGQTAIDPDSALRACLSSKERSLWVFRDLEAWLQMMTVRRLLRSVARDIISSGSSEARTIVVLGSSPNIPPDLLDYARLIEWGIPDRAEIASVLDTVIRGLPSEVAVNAAPNGVRDAVIEAAIGLTAEQASSCYAQSLVTQAGKILPTIVAREKRRVVSGKGLEWFDPDPRGMAAIGGLDELKSWLITRKSAFSKRAREFGLPAPRGILMVGVPGTGKSLTAKVVATTFEIPLVRLDLGGAQSMYVGESQQNLRKALRVIDALGRCVVWIDEIEKSLAGSINGAADGGVSADQLGTLLSWMQERKGESFVIATANDVSKLPPEFLRKGRFDEIFWVDLPIRRERQEILAVALKQFKRNPDEIDLNRVADACGNFTGSEIAAIVPDALFQAFADNERSLTTADLIESASKVTPLAKTAAEKIKALREWATERARPASSKEQAAVQAGSRALDIDTGIN